MLLTARALLLLLLAAQVHLGGLVAFHLLLGDAGEGFVVNALIFRREGAALRREHDPLLALSTCLPQATSRTPSPGGPPGLGWRLPASAGPSPPAPGSAHFSLQPTAGRPRGSSPGLLLPLELRGRGFPPGSSPTSPGCRWAALAPPLLLSHKRATVTTPPTVTRG